MQKETFSESILAPILAAGKELGYPTADPNGSGQTRSFSPVPVSISKGKRIGTYGSFAEKFAGKNLHVVTHAQVSRVLFKDNKAIGVELERFGKKEQIYTNQEVILSAGSIGTPQILMLSGVGDKDELAQHNIPLVLHSPEVGKNLQDHIFPHVPYKAPKAMSHDTLKLVQPTALTDYLMQGTGPLTSIGGVVGTGFIHTAVNNDTRPDIQLIFASLTWAVDFGTNLRKICGLGDEAFDWYKEQPESEFGVMIAPVLSRPKSKGSIKLRSSDPMDHPIIEANYLRDKFDLDTLASSLEFLHNLVETKAFKEAGIELFDPFPPCAHNKFR